MIYVASPYTSSLPSPMKEQMEATRFDQVRAFTHHLLSIGYVAFSPILYCRPIAMIEKLPQDAEFWWRFNADFLRRSEGIFVFKLPGWDQSKGVQVELKMAKALHIPRVDWNPDLSMVPQPEKK